MKLRVLALALALPLVACGGGDPVASDAPESGTAIWGRRFGKSTTPDGVALAVDGSGNVIVAGRFFGTADFGKGPITSPANNWQAFVAKYDREGDVAWVRSFGGIYEEQITRVATDDAGNVYIGGGFRGTIDFGGATLQATSGQGDSFVAKLSADGSHVWSQRVVGFDYTMLAGMSVNGDGDVALAVQSPFFQPVGGSSTLITKLRTDGTVAYAVPLKGLYEYASVDALAIDGTGAIVVSALFYDDSVGPAQRLAKLGDAGEVLWLRPFDPSGDLGVLYLAIAADGGLHVSGWASPDVAYGEQECFVAALTADGEQRWLHRYSVQSAETDSQVFPGYASISPRALAVRDDRIVLGGTFIGQIDFGGGVRTNVLPGEDPYASTADVFTLVLDADGERVWDTTIDGASPSATSVGLDHEGNAFVAGSSRGKLPFGDDTLAGTGYYDGFVVELAR